VSVLASARLHRVAGRTLAVTIGLAVGLVVAEMLVRTVSPQGFTPLVAGFGPEGMVELDPRYGWRFVGGRRWTWQRGTTVDINSLGFRDREYGPKAPNEIRVLSLGDSFGFGAGVELDETYAKVLERRLGGRFPAVPVSVINAGVSGYGQRQELLTFADQRSRLDPDLVIATFVAGNDVENNAVLDAQLRDRIKSPVGFVGRHSHAVRLLFRIGYPITDALMNRNPRHIARTIELLRQLEHELAAAGVPYLMVIIPARHQVRPQGDRLVAWLLDWGLDGFVFRQNRAVVEHFVRERVPYVDTLPALAARDRVESVVFEDDAHTNALGHEVIAEAILEKLAPLVDETIARRALPPPESHVGAGS
jgi:lysophospholipase L1-like esterase